MKLKDQESFDAFLMLESMTESILITTADFDEPGPYIIYVNPAFEKMTGWKKDEIYWKSPRILQGPKTEYGIFRNLRSTLEKGEIWSGRTINYRKDGSEFYMQWSIVPIKENSGEIKHYLAVQKDVSSIVETEQRLIASRKEEAIQHKKIKRTNKKLKKLIAQQKQTLDLFIKYVPEPVIKKALTKGATDKDGEQLEVALLFCDMRKFTAITESLYPNQVVQLLNTYYSYMSEVIKKHKGVVNQFVGDEIFVTFGAPEPIHDPAGAAVNCALEMIRELKIMNKSLKPEIEKDIVVGIGINYGSVIAGNLGSDDWLSYSVSGEAVIIAKRIESLTRSSPNSILISHSIYEQIKEVIPTKPLGEVPLQGKNQKEKVYQVIQETK